MEKTYFINKLAKINADIHRVKDEDRVAMHHDEIEAKIEQYRKELEAQIEATKEADLEKLAYYRQFCLESIDELDALEQARAAEEEVAHHEEPQTETPAID